MNQAKKQLSENSQKLLTIGTEMKAKQQLQSRTQSTTEKLKQEVSEKFLRKFS